MEKTYTVTIKTSDECCCVDLEIELHKIQEELQNIYPGTKINVIYSKENKKLKE